jgi:hypothetical protein
MKKTATMQVLDEYAKKLTKKQMNMLYEQKMSKKYTKKIYEAEDDYVEYSLYLDSYIISELEMTPEDVTDEVRAEFGNDIRISESSTGLNFVTSDSTIYGDLLVFLEELGVEPATISDLTDPNYLNDTDY